MEDTINLLQGKQTVSETCVQAFARFLTLPTKENKSSLQEAYNAIPKHLRIYVLGDMDCKDSAIRMCIENTEISQEILESLKRDYEWIFEPLN